MQALAYGFWEEQGTPFYPYAVQYEYAVCLNAISAGAILDVSNGFASVVSATVNGEYVGVIHHNGKRGRDIAAHLKRGSNRIVLRVCGSLKNQWAALTAT